MVPDDRPSWHAANETASFVPYEPVGAGIEAVWAGGFGGGLGTTGHLEICALTAGVEISVETVGVRRHSDSKVRLSLLVHQLIGNHTLAGADIELPYSITVAKDDRQISVSGRKVIFNGVRIDETPHWIGEAEIDDLLIRVALPDAVDFELRPCSDPDALADRPPQPE